MATATFRHGDSVHMADYTPSGAIAAGDVVIIGAYPKIAHRPIAANVKGALADRGGTYRMTAGASITAGVDVYMNASTGKVNKLASATSGDKHIGRMTDDSTAAADGDLVEVLHEPNGTAKS